MNSMMILRCKKAVSIAYRSVARVTHFQSSGGSAMLLVSIVRLAMSASKGDEGATAAMLVLLLRCC